MNVAQMLRNTLFGEDDWGKLNLAMRVVALEKQNKELQGRIQTLEIKHEALECRTLGWQEGFGGEVRKQLRRMDERITNLEAKDER